MRELSSRRTQNQCNCGRSDHLGSYNEAGRITARIFGRSSGVKEYPENLWKRLILWNAGRDPGGIFIASSTEINQGIGVKLMKKVKDELFSSAP